MSQASTSDELGLIERARELRIATRRDDGSWRRAVPIWVVCVDGGVYVRTWYRRDTGWYGRALRQPRALIDVAGLTAETKVNDVGIGAAGLRERIDAAYLAKYHNDAGMVSDEAAASTLRLEPRRPA